VAQWHVP